VLRFYRFLSKKRDNANKFLKKEIGIDFTSISMLLFFAFGVIVLIFCLYINLIKLNEFISAFILWFTAIVVLDYTKETHDLKENSVRQIHEIRKQNDYEMRPYLRLQWVGNSNSILQIVNDGKGIALDVKFSPIIFYDQREKSEFKIKSRPLIVGSHGWSDISRKEIFEGYAGLLDENSTFYGYLDSKINLGFLVKVTYKDFEEHTYLAVFKSNEEYNDRFEILEQARTK
jgi:hypothetical protein